MTRPPPAFRRLALLALVLLAGGAVWWLLRDRAGAPDGSEPVERAPTPEEATDLERAAAAPLLQGAPDATSPPPSVAPPAETWTLDFEVLDSAGEPRYWYGAQIRDRQGMIVQAIDPPEWDDPRGRIEVVGSGYLVVLAFECVPWASAWLEPPPSGKRHLVAHLDGGLSVAGMVYEQDGETPLKSGDLEAWTAARHDPFRPAVNARHGPIRRDGSFVVKGLPRGAVRLRVKAYDHTQGRPVQTDVRAGDENVRLVLGPQGAIAFLIVDEATGFAPVAPQLHIYTITADEERVWSYYRSAKPEEGVEAKPTTWRLASPGETVRFRIRAQGYEPSEIVTVAVPEAGGKQVVRVELRAAPESEAKLRIRFRTEDGTVPEWLPVTFHLGQGSSNSTHLEVANESVEVTLMPGAHHLSVGRMHHPQPENPNTFWVPAEVKLDLAPGEDREVEVFLHRGGWVVIDGDPDPRPRQVTLTSGDEVVKRFASWGPWGKEHETGYHLGVLPVGTWTLEYTGRESGRRTTFDVEREKIVRLDPRTFDTFPK